MRWLVITYVTLALILAACADDVSDQGGLVVPTGPAATTEPSSTAVPFIEAAECNGDCTLRYVIDGETYDPYCAKVKPELVTSTLVARARDDLEIDDAYAVGGFPMVLAVNVGANFCHNGVKGTIGLFGPGDRGSDPLEVALAFERARCEAFTTADATCETGGSARHSWWDEETQTHHTDYAYFPDVVVNVDNALRVGTGPAWRADPLRVVEEWWNDDVYGLWFLCDPGENREWQYACRVSGRWLSDTRYRLRFMQLTEVNDPPEPNFEGADFVVTVEQTGDGPSWWVTGYTEQALVESYSTVGEQEAAAAWESYWIPTDDVWADVDRYGLGD